MKFYVKQHVFTWGDKFSIYDEGGNVIFAVEGEVFTFGKKLHLYDVRGNELSFISQEIFAFKPRYYIERQGTQVAEVVKHFTFFSNEFSVEGLGWTVSGDLFDHDYSVYDASDRQIAQVTKEWFTFGDSYCYEIDNSVDVVNALSVLIVIDAVMTDRN